MNHEKENLDLMQTITHKRPNNMGIRSTVKNYINISALDQVFLPLWRWLASTCRGEPGEGPAKVTIEALETRWLFPPQAEA